MNSLELCRKAGITYRQLDYWVRKGYLGDDRVSKGTGNYRDWSNTDASHAVLMAGLIKGGLAPAWAHQVAAASPETATEIISLLAKVKP